MITLKNKKILLIFLLIWGCKNNPSAIPTGEWHYTLFINSYKAGTATISNKIKNNSYINKSILDMKTPYTKNYFSYKIIESKNFTPIMLITQNKITVKNKTSEWKTAVEFKNNTIFITKNKIKTKLIIPQNFVLEGNYFLSELIKANFKKGTILKKMIYNPTIALEKPILITIKSLGYEIVKINGKNRNLIHITETIEDTKTIDSFLDKNGVVIKSKIYMLNNKIELVKK